MTNGSVSDRETRETGVVYMSFSKRYIKFRQFSRDSRLNVSDKSKCKRLRDTSGIYVDVAVDVDLAVNVAVNVYLAVDVYLAADVDLAVNVDLAVDVALNVAVVTFDCKEICTC